VSATHNVTVTGYDEALLRLLDLATNDNVVAAAVVAGGTGYTVGDILTVSGGTVVNSLVATLEVTSVAAGVIDGIRVFNTGAYSAQPGNPVSVTGGTGTLATFNLTFETQNWIINRNDASSTSNVDNPDVAGGGGTQILEREVLLEGPGNAGADQIFVGILQVRDTGIGIFNWQLFGMTGFNNVLLLEDQPGFSYLEPNEFASFVPLTDGSIECWHHVTPRALSGVMRIGSTYQSFYVGFLNPFATPVEYPYPLYIAGTTSKWNRSFSSSGPSQSGIVDPGASTETGGNTRGPAGVRFVDGTWQFVKNWHFASTTRTTFQERCVYPARQLVPSSTRYNEASRFVPTQANRQWDGVIPSTGNPGTPATTIRETEDSGGGITILVPTIVWSSLPSLQILGEIDSFFWASTAGNNILSQDRVIVGGIHYRAFQQANRTDQFAFQFLREDA
jgi:hypothetical protein